MPPKILLFGSGAIGTVYVYLLLKAGCDVTAVCRSNYDAAKISGFRLNSDLYGHDIHVQPRVVRDCTEAASYANEPPYDYVVVTTKALPASRTPSLVAPAISPGKTTIVLIQNGIDIEPEYASAFPSNPLLSCVVYLPTTQVSPGVIEMGDSEKLEVGTYPSSRSTDPYMRAPADWFVETLRQAGSNVDFYADIQERRWCKLLLNAPWNPICALTFARDVAVLQACEASESVIAGVMSEVVAISQGLGYTSVTMEGARNQLQRATTRLGTQGIEPSMLTDVREGRRMEVEVILGNPVKVAARLGISVPRMEMLYALVKVLDESAAWRKTGESLGGDVPRSA